MRRRTVACICLFLSAISIHANNNRHTRDTSKYSDSYLDTVKISKVFTLNDYGTVNVEYGVSFNSMLFNPVYSQGWRYTPGHYEITYTKYNKMFGYMPYFGYKIGLSYGHEGYVFKPNKETHYQASIEGASEAVYEIAELPFLAHFHYDMPDFKLFLDVGLYGGYRLSIDRIGDAVPEDIKHTFLDTDIRFDYGLRGAVGFALVLSPVEFFVSGKVRYSWSNIYQADYASRYYYRFAYPLDIMVTAGLSFQLSKRSGKSRQELRKDAREIVNNPVAE